MKYLKDKPVRIEKFFLKHGKKIAYQKDQTFIRTDDPVPWVYFIAEGRVKVSFFFDSGSERTIGYFIPTNTFAQSRSFFEDNGGDLEFTTIEPCVIYRVHRDEFFEQIDTDHKFLKEYLGLVLLYQLFMTDRLIYLGEGNVEQQFIHWLRFMCNWYGEKTGNQCRISVPLTHEAIASFLHVSRESVSKIMRKYARDGYITTTKKYITINNIERLKERIK